VPGFTISRVAWGDENPGKTGNKIFPFYFLLYGVPGARPENALPKN